MNCEQIQANLLDYGKGRLSSNESSRIKQHLDHCVECRALLEEELAFDLQLSSLPVEEPANDVWALVRAQIKPKRVSPLALLRGAYTTHYRRTVATAVALGAVAAVVFSNLPVEEKQSPVDTAAPPMKSVAVVKWSDDPLGKHTDAMVDLIDKM